MYYPCSENKGADQLRGYREADLRLCFRICKKPVFSKRGSIFSSEMDSEPPIKKPKSNGAMKEEKPFVTNSPADTVEEVSLLFQRHSFEPRCEKTGLRGF